MAVEKVTMEGGERMRSTAPKKRRRCDTGVKVVKAGAGLGGDLRRGLVLGPHDVGDAQVAGGAHAHAIITQLAGKDNRREMR